MTAWWISLFPFVILLIGVGLFLTIAAPTRRVQKQFPKTLEPPKDQVSLRIVPDVGYEWERATGSAGRAELGLAYNPVVSRIGQLFGLYKSKEIGYGVAK